MRSRFLGAGIVLTSLLVSSSEALERRAFLDSAAPPSGGWFAGGSCAVWYYNRCTLWSWAWSGFAPGERIGVNYITRSCNDTGGLQVSIHRVITGSPAGYGYTGTMSVVL